MTEDRLAKIEEMLAKLLSYYEEQDRIISETIEFPYPPKDYEALGVISDKRLKENADKFYKESGGYTAPEFFLPDLDGFNDKFRTYRSVIDAAPLTNIQKATYWHTTRSASIMAMFLGKRREYYVTEVVPEGQGKGPAAYGFQSSTRKYPDVILVPGIKTVEDAIKWQENWIKNFYGVGEAIRRD